MCLIAESITVCWDAEPCSVAKRFLRNVRLTALTEDVTCPSDCTCWGCYLSVRLHLPKMLPVPQTALAGDATYPSDCTYRRLYLSLRLHLLGMLPIRQTALTEDVTCPSDCTCWGCYLSVRLHLLGMLPVRQTALTEDVTCPPDCTYRRFYLSVRLHLLKTVVACNVFPRRQQSSGSATLHQKYGNLSCNKTFIIFFTFGKEPSNSLKIDRIWPVEHLVTVVARGVNFKLRSCRL